MLKNKTILLGVTGSIAAYKIANLASMLVKLQADVHVIMTKNATNFIHPTTFETLTGNKCLIDTFDRNFQFHVAHISLAKKADVVLVAPATANVIGKLANGIADDMLTTTVLACKCPIYISPVMNSNMYTNQIVTDNIHKLSSYGYPIIEPTHGNLACGDSGIGKMPSETDLLDYLLREIHYPKDMSGKRVLITAGATQESIDPVRFITNHSTGKMGFALARVAMERGADVTVIAGYTTAAFPPFVKMIPVKSASEMFDAVLAISDTMDIIIKSAAVSDYTPISVDTEKIKKSEDTLSIPLIKTKDILAHLGAHRQPDQLLCGFSMETTNMIPYAKEKLTQKKLDLIVANNIKEEGAGFGTDTNVVTLITRDSINALPLMSKENVAKEILDKLLELSTC